MEQYSPDDFARQSRRVRSPNSDRRKVRLVRFAALSAGLTIVALALLSIALGG